MFNAGLVSVSFRQLSPEDVIECAKKAGLKYIEWGSDVHAPYSDGDALCNIAKMQNAAGMSCCSYGTYFRVGRDRPEKISEYICAAQTLGTDILRIWCGTKGYSEYSAQELSALVTDCKEAARIASEQNVTLCLECHGGTVTDCIEGALFIMNAVALPSFRMYWQPDKYKTEAENLDYAVKISNYTKHIHVFNWHGEEKCPLGEAKEQWKRYLSAFSGDKFLLLEFMPDDSEQSLPVEAQALTEIIKETK